MFFNKILGNNNIKEVLIKEVSCLRIPHAQLFNEAYGVSALPMALALAMYLFCKKKKRE